MFASRFVSWFQRKPHQLILSMLTVLTYNYFDTQTWDDKFWVKCWKGHFPYQLVRSCCANKNTANELQPIPKQNMFFWNQRTDRSPQATQANNPLDTNSIFCHLAGPVWQWQQGNLAQIGFALWEVSRHSKQPTLQYSDLCTFDICQPNGFRYLF